MRMKTWIRRAFAVAGLTLTALAANAQLPFGTLELLQPSATVSSNESIELRVRFTLDPSSAAINFSSYPLTGLAASDLPQQGYHYDPATATYSYADFARIDRVYFNAGLSCSGGPESACGGSGPYQLQFVDGSNPQMPGLVYVDHFNLAPGASYDYTVALLTPQAGGVPVGTSVSIFNIQLTLDYTGVDANGNWLAAVNRPVVASVCSNYSDPSCVFTRTVTAVPEPASYALMAIGGIAVFGLARRRRRVDLRA